MNITFARTAERRYRVSVGWDKVAYSIAKGSFIASAVQRLSPSALAKTRPNDIFLV